MVARRTTLTQFLIEERRRHPNATGELNALILNVALACKAVAREVAGGALARNEDAAPTAMRAVAHEIFVGTTEWSGQLLALASAHEDGHRPVAPQYPRGRYLLVIDPLDGASNTTVNSAAGSIFSILRSAGDDVSPGAFLQPGCRQVCAGYAIYGPATLIVLTVGTGVHGFTLDPLLGEFFLTHPRLQVPAATDEFAIDAAHGRLWEPAVKRYVSECLAGVNGPRGQDFSMRWIASLVAETHRILLRGGVCLVPRHAEGVARAAHPRLLHEASPLAFLVEQAGGRASSGRTPLLDLVPEALHQCTPLLFGSRAEIDRIESYHHDESLGDFDAPLFGSRGLFRSAA